MSARPRIVALVPARAGSKGVVGKNTRVVAGRPLVAWTLEAAQDSRLVDAVMVSSDDPAVLAISRQAGVDYVVERPAELASDTAPMVEVIAHALASFESPLADTDVLVLMQPTSPLRTALHVDEALELLLGGDAQAVVGVCKAEHSPLLMNTLPADHTMSGFLERRVSVSNRQEFPEYYRINGAIYCARIGYLREAAGFMGEATVAFVMPQAASFDIDSELDVRIAECLLGG